MPNGEILYKINHSDEFSILPEKANVHNWARSPISRSHTNHGVQICSLTRTKRHDRKRSSYILRQFTIQKDKEKGKNRKETTPEPETTVIYKKDQGNGLKIKETSPEAEPTKIYRRDKERGKKRKN